MARRVHGFRRFDGQAEPERQRMHDKVPVTAEPGFYEPGRSPSLLLANWFWLRHIIRALRHWGHEPYGRSTKWMQRLECGAEIGLSMVVEGVATSDCQLSAGHPIKSETADGIL